MYANDPCRTARAALLFAEGAYVPKGIAKSLAYRFAQGEDVIDLPVAALKLCSLPQPTMCEINVIDGAMLLRCDQVRDSALLANIDRDVSGLMAYMREHASGEPRNVLVHGASKWVVIDEAEFRQMLHDYPFLLFMNSAFRRTTTEERARFGAMWAYEARLRGNS
jgi:hypothetical protein